MSIYYLCYYTIEFDESTSRKLSRHSHVIKFASFKKKWSRDQFKCIWKYMFKLKEFGFKGIFWKEGLKLKLLIFTVTIYIIKKIYNWWNQRWSNGQSMTKCGEKKLTFFVCLKGSEKSNMDIWCSRKKYFQKVGLKCTRRNSQVNSLKRHYKWKHLFLHLM